jgi:flagellar hook-associated protein 3 FlgL
MRISTNMIYSQGTATVQSQLQSLVKVQQQISSGIRITEPSDDPLAATRVVQTGQSLAATTQFAANGGVASDALNAQETALRSANDTLAAIRTLAVHAGDSSLTLADRTAVATELQGDYNFLLGLANTSNNGLYLFSGSKGGTTPFTESTPGVVTYNGDQNQQLAQISSSRQVPITSAGVEIFQRIANGNGTFFTSADPAVTGVTNTGTGVVGPGTVTNAALWNAAGNTQQYKVVFATDTTVQPPVTTYDIVATANTTVNGQAYAAGTSLLTNAVSAATASAGGGPNYPRVYTEGQSLPMQNIAGDTNPFAWNLGINLNMSGQPTSATTVGPVPPTPASDTFDIKPSVNNQDIFATVHGLIAALQSGSKTNLSNVVTTTLSNLDQAETSINKAITNIGVTGAEITAQQTTNASLTLQYNAQISTLQSTDIAAATTQLTQLQANLTAAQKSFILISGLSLFDFLNPSAA